MPDYITIYTDDEEMKAKHSFGILMALETASKATMCCRHGACLLLSRKKALTTGYNKQPISYNKQKRSQHAEIECCSKVPKEQLKGLTLYVAHINNTGLIGRCKCCKDCRKSVV